MEKATAVVVVALLVTVLSAAAGAHAQTIEPVDALIAIDANGRKVGIYHGNAVGPFMVNRRTFVDDLLLGTSDFLSDFFATYESTDCTGTPYYTQGPYTVGLGAVTGPPLVGPPGKTLYLPDFNGPKNIIVKSSGTETSCQPATTGGTSLVGFPLVPVVDLNTQFTPPFHLVSAPSSAGGACCGDCNGDGTVTINEIITGVNAALNGCPK